MPGYNFTRLPLRIFLPTGDCTGEFISRPRAIALREFGPQNIIYHNGRKYRVSQLVVQDAESSLTEAKISKQGRLLPGGGPEGPGNLPLLPASTWATTPTRNTCHHLLEMAESRAERSTAFPARRKSGSRAATRSALTSRWMAASWSGSAKAMVRSSENALLNLRYIPAARLVHVNYKWRTQEMKGFPIGLISGDWRSSMPSRTARSTRSFGW